MATISPSITVHSGLLAGQPEITIYTKSIQAVSHDVRIKERAVIHTDGGHSFQAVETYEEILKKIKEA